MNVVSTIMIAIAFVGQAPAQTTAERLAEQVKGHVAESRAPAEAAVKELKQLATRDNYKSLGFESLDEVKQAELGKPLPVVIVRLDELKTHKRNDDPLALLHAVPKVMYAVNVQGKSRSGVEVEKRDGKWEASSFGVSPVARRHADALKKQAAKDQGRLFFIIKVLALNKSYLSYQNDQGAWLIEVRWDDENAKVDPRPAADVLAELVKLAQEHDGGFR